MSEEIVMGSFPDDRTTISSSDATRLGFVGFAGRFLPCEGLDADGPDSCEEDG